MKLDLPKQVTEILDKLKSYGYSAYIHGECVRSLIKGQTTDSKASTEPSKIGGFDFDVLTNAEMPRVLAVFDEYNTIEENLHKGELIVTVLGVAVSITCYTSLERELGDEHAFTFDAIAYSCEDGFVDPFSGREDLQQGKLNFIHQGKAFNPHDILAALAWQSSGEFTITDKSKELILINAEGAICTKKDLEAVLMGRNAATVLGEYSGIFTAVIPELGMLSPEMLQRTFKSVGASSPVLALRYALLFSELGKPDCRSESPDESEHFYGHIERSRIYAVRIMARLGCSAELLEETGLIIENHEKVSGATKDNILDLRDEYQSGLLKLLLLFNCAVFRADSNEKQAMMLKKLLKGM
jgi:tRNA nucleotidyltransferase (CCA-adding enzyme)